MPTAISTPAAPAAIGPYSQGVDTSCLVFCSGQIPIDPKTGQLEMGTIEEQAERVLENVKAIIEGAGFTMNQVVKATVFATTMENFAPINGVYSRYFSENPPARSFVAVKALPKDAQVEIEVVAWKG